MPEKISLIPLARRPGGDGVEVAPAPAKPGWREVWRVYAEAATLRMLALGFSAGLPLLQAAIIAGLAGMALSDPKLSLKTSVWFALLTALGSATRDIAQDALRIKIFGHGADAAGRCGRGVH